MGYFNMVDILLRHMEWFEAVDLFVKGIEGAKLLKCSDFGDAIVANMQSATLIFERREPWRSRLYGWDAD